MSEVWVVEQGDYSDRMVWLVADSHEAAVQAVKGLFQDPYVVDWYAPIYTPQATNGHGPSYTLSGVFARVDGFAVAHTARFEITRYDLIGEEQTDHGPGVTTETKVG